MKKTLFTFIAGFVGLASALGVNYRATFEYGNLTDNGTYTRQTIFDPGNCHVAAVKPCHYTYTATTPLASPITEAALIAAGAVPSAEKTLYIAP